MRILYSEDDADSRDMMTILLDMVGYEVIAASGTTDALELATQDSFDLIILDNWYESGSGVELCKQIRRFDSSTPIIFYSGAAYESDIQQAIEAGAQDYLIKPTGIHVLVKTIQELTQHARSLSTVQ